MFFSCFFKPDVGPTLEKQIYLDIYLSATLFLNSNPVMIDFIFHQIEIDKLNTSDVLGLFKWQYPVPINVGIVPR